MNISSKDIPVGVGRNGRLVEVPVVVARSGRTRFDIAFYVEKENFLGEAGRVVAADAIKQILLESGFTHPMELVVRRFDEAMASESKWAGVSVEVDGINCGYPVIRLESASRSTAFSF